MIKNRRLLSIILIVIMTSVFFVSCGIPTYITLSEISIQSTKNEDEYILSFTGSDSDLQYINDGPGLILLYVESDSSANTFSSSVISSFAKEFGSKDTIGIKAVVLNSDEPVINLDSAKAYSFSINGSKVSPWKYHFDISANSTSNTILSSYTISKDGNSIKVIDINQNEFILTKSNNDLFTTNNFVHIFAAFSCQSTNNNNFSNIYWSDLAYVGYFQI